MTSRKPQFSVFYRCGGKHRSSECRFKDVTCHNCGKQGHIAKVCKSNARCRKQAPPSSFRQKTTHMIQVGATAMNLETESEYTPFHIGNSSMEPLLISATVNSAELSMEVDTGATRSIISLRTYHRL